MKSLIKKIFEAKKEIGKISKDSTNPFYKSKYFDINALLEHVESVLEKHGLMVLQPIVQNNVVSEIYDIETGEKIESSIELPEIKDPQKLGSAITYYRRYTLQSLLSLQAEDDDANKTVEKKPNNFKHPEKTQKPWLNIYTGKDKKALTEQFKNCYYSIHDGVVSKDGEIVKFTVSDIRKKYAVSKETEKELNNAFFMTKDI